MKMLKSKKGQFFLLSHIFGAFLLVITYLFLFIGVKGFSTSILIPILVGSITLVIGILLLQRTNILIILGNIFESLMLSIPIINMFFAGIGAKIFSGMFLGIASVLILGFVLGFFGLGFAVLSFTFFSVLIFLLISSFVGLLVVV